VLARLLAVWNTPWIASGSQRLTSAGVSDVTRYSLLPDRPDCLSRLVLVGGIADHRVGNLRPQSADLQLVVAVPGRPPGGQLTQRLLRGPDPAGRSLCQPVLMLTKLSAASPTESSMSLLPLCRATGSTFSSSTTKIPFHSAVSVSAFGEPAPLTSTRSAA
jgi:hypothetical protein